MNGENFYHDSRAYLVNRSHHIPRYWADARERFRSDARRQVESGRGLTANVRTLDGATRPSVVTEQYLRLVPGRFVKPLSSLQAPPHGLTHLRPNSGRHDYRHGA
jgi:hypothetical protein